MPDRSPIDCRAAVGVGLRDTRRAAAFATSGHEVDGIGNACPRPEGCPEGHSPRSVEPVSRSAVPVAVVTRASTMGPLAVSIISRLQCPREPGFQPPASSSGRSSPTCVTSRRADAPPINLEGTPIHSASARRHHRSCYRLTSTFDGDGRDCDRNSSSCPPSRWRLLGKCRSQRAHAGGLAAAFSLCFGPARIHDLTFSQVQQTGEQGATRSSE